MTTPAIRNRIAASGFAPARIAAASRLFDTAFDAFERMAGGPPDHAWWIPGRIEVFGRHTDYAGGHSLVCAAPRGFAVVARARTDRKVRLLDALRHDEFVLDGSGSAVARPGDAPAGRVFSGWRNYADVAVRRLLRNFPAAALGADIVLASDLPSASGMSSSSALVVGLAAALAWTARLPERADWQQTLRTPVDEAGYYACIENGMSFGPLTGDAGVGTHGGSEDHVAIVCGRAEELGAWRFVPIAHVGSVVLPADWMFVIATSGVAARKTGEAREAYNRLSREAGALLDLARRSGSAAPSLGAALGSSASTADRLLALIRQRSAGAPDEENLERRLQHFRDENARVLDALEACRAGDRHRMGMLSERSQADAEALLRNQVPETIALARRARERGAFAASSFGAGFGGSVWALVERDEAAGFAAAWMADYRASFPERPTATSFIARPGPPLTQLE